MDGLWRPKPQLWLSVSVQTVMLLVLSSAAMLSSLLAKWLQNITQYWRHTGLCYSLMI
jgi:hypothetical protein